MDLSRQQNDRSPDTSNFYAWLSRDADGVEGILVWPLGGMIMLLGCTDGDRARRMEPYARKAAAARGFPAELVRFKRDETLAKVGP